MSDLLNKYLHPKKEQIGASGAAAFPIRQMMLFRWKTGNCLALPYAYLLWVNFNPSEAMTLHFNTHTVTVRGVNLKQLFDAILSFEVSEVVEVTARLKTANDDEPEVTEIFVKQLHEEHGEE
jgi:hypothetical protein